MTRAAPLSRSNARRASDALPTVPAVPAARDEALLRLLDENGVGLAFQPQWSIRSGEVIGVEALARAPEGVAPEDLFARAAQSSLSERLSRNVQRKVLHTVGAWQGRLGQLRLSLNLLPEDLARPGYERWLLDEIAAAGLSPERVTAEITESSLIADPTAAAARLACLRAAGVRIAVDDFGTGYSSLAWLTTLPLDLIKIDRGLIRDLVGGRRAQIVVKALIALARELELEVLVEGVEDPGQLALLEQWGCDLYQGFLGARAMSEKELGIFLN
ncbi:EAL domain-containing protein [Sphingomonas sp. LHG3406-1]|uniref:EAL domain-containing protein n=1 Tax=Sphingomonas sp. LHG3406-1 TaxID=2804617 RepID=UPI002624D614|nr:EAL domain-containing protein [Sphingomonas sp. LHG3406-1]